MIFTPLSIPDAVLIDLEPIEDERGFFARAWCRQESKTHCIAGDPVQINIARNHLAGTLRGLHYQLAPYAETKIIRCLCGAIFDIVVDLRPDSPTFTRWAGVELTASNHRSLFVPEGCAHGYLTLVDDTEVLYQVSTCYHPASERGVRWDDPAFGIILPAPVRIISDKDRNWPDFNP